MDIMQRIRVILNTLGLVEVRGKQNLDFLLGCIKALESILQELTERGQDNAAGQPD